MFYRVDYILAVLLAGFLIGLLVSKATASVPATRLAQGYYLVIAFLLVLRAGVFTAAMVVTSAHAWNAISGLIGDLLGFLFGALFGIAFRRKDAREFLTNQPIVDALCITLAFTFALAGIGKAFSIAPMTEFFTQSGYSIGFFKFIVIAEIFGVIGILLPWARIPAMIGLTVDMFGAILTHIHNGDPLNDSTGAIGMLIRLVALGILLALRQRRGEECLSVRKGIVITSAITAACLLIAFSGSIVVRHLSASPTRVSLPAAR